MNHAAETLTEVKGLPKNRSGNLPERNNDGETIKSKWAQQASAVDERKHQRIEDAFQKQDAG
jgi:hypothetical protein